jgi:hypothetical protein
MPRRGGGCCSCCFPPDPDSEDLISPRERRSTDGQRLPIKRHCTDCLCLLLFVLTACAAAVVAKAAFRVGDPERLTNGVDYMGNVCGRGPLAGRPYVFYPLLSDDLAAHRELLAKAPWAVPLYGLCVPACPTQGEQVADYGCARRHRSCRWRDNPLISWCDPLAPLHRTSPGAAASCARATRIRGA